MEPGQEPQTLQHCENSLFSPHIATQDHHGVICTSLYDGEAKLFSDPNRKPDLGNVAGFDDLYPRLGHYPNKVGMLTQRSELGGLQ